ncbi:MAG: flavodoxin domain-containing protein [Pseudomonadota bacterium]
MAASLDSLATVLPGESAQALSSAIAGLDREQLIWSSGFLAGLAQTMSGDPAAAVPVAPVAAAAETWHVYFATETGNSERVAQSLADSARAAGAAVEVSNLREVRPRSLVKVERAVFVLATHGVGEPPEGTEGFFDFWNSDKAPSLDQLEFGIVALGDSSYADFCQVGRDFEARLLELGASAVIDRADCDLDYEKPAADWAEQLARKVAETAPATAVVTDHPARHAGVHDRARPFEAELLSNQKITGRGSSKDVRHVELLLEGSGLSYLPGDSLGVKPTNPPELVATIIEQAGLDGDAAVEIDGETQPLSNALEHSREISLLSRPVLDTVAAQQKDLAGVLESRDRLAEYLATRQLTDLLAEYPIDWQPQSFVDALRGLTPRLYSIASSPDANPDEAHLTVGVVRYEQFGRDHWGSASNYLAGGAERVPVYIEPNDRFRLPADGDTPIIMIGAGTGVAPYRAFVEHRREHGHSGRNWLFFGDRNFDTDFLYQLEWLRYRKDGLLTGLDVAFSRDQAEKVYVQDRLLERSADVYAWIEEGAHLYVCGDAERMAVDVDAALHTIVAREGGLNSERAAEVVSELKAAGRYQRDVY